MTITEHDERVPEFSMKEVCDIISTLMCCNEDNILEEVTLEKAIRTAFVRFHSDCTVANLIHHIEMVGLHDVANTIEERKRLYDV